MREEEYEVIHVADGEEALACYGRRVADVLITDVKLPGGIDGWQIAEHCRATLSDSAMNLAKLYQQTHLISSLKAFAKAC